jgi:hypothetical protein
MASVVFMRGVNVGGHKAFRPSELARRLESLEVQSIGAAGTFVVGADAPEPDVRRQFAKQIPFETELMVCSKRDREPSPAIQGAIDQRTVRGPAPSLLPFDARRGRQEDGSTGLWCPSRAAGPGLSNEVVERAWVAATTRNWIRY